MSKVSSGTRTARRLAIAGTVGSAVVLVGLAQPAKAAQTVVRGSAFGHFAKDISLFGGVQPNNGPTPSVTLAANASNSPQAAVAPTALVQYGPAVLLTADQVNVSTSGSAGTNGSATASSIVRNINRAATQPSTGSEILTATSAASSCSASLSGRSGSTTISGGTLQTDSGLDANGDGDFIDPGEHAPVVVPLPASPAANTTLTGHIHLSATSTDSFQVVLNEQVANTDGSLTVTAVHERFLGQVLYGELIIGQSTCGVSRR